MKNLIYLIALLSMVSCGPDEIPGPKTHDYADSFEEARSNFRSTELHVQVMVVDSCEYIIWAGSHQETGFTHKGSCNYCWRKLERMLSNKNKK